MGAGVKTRYSKGRSLLTTCAKSLASPVPKPAATAANVEQGRDIFLGYRRLAGAGLPAFRVIAPTASALSAAVGAGKQHPLQPEEILALIAYFEDSAKHGREDNGVAPLNFFLIGLGGTAAGLVLCHS